MERASSGLGFGTKLVLRLPPAVSAEPRPVSHSSSVLTRWMGVADANVAGNVHGGAIMRICDEVAGIAAIRHSGGRVVTAAMDRMTFLHPVMVGMLLTVRASVNAAWRSSMEVGVRVEAENVRTGEVVHASTAYLTMVALDDDGRTSPVPAIECTSHTDRRREREAQLRRAKRLPQPDQIVKERGGG